MSVTNEIVKFIAGIELDPKDKEAFTKALKESNDICAAFRQEIAETEKEIEKLAKAGKKDSDEFKKLNSQLEITKSKLQSSSKEANKYASILGINSMSYNQLRNPHCSTRQHRRTDHGKQSSSTAPGRSGTADRPEPGTPDAQGIDILA